MDIFANLSERAKKELYESIQRNKTAAALYLNATGDTATGPINLDKGAVTASSGAATLNKQTGQVTTASLTTAIGANYTLTLTNSLVAAAKVVVVSVGNGTNTGGTPIVSTVTPGDGSVVIIVKNDHASTALNGTLLINFAVLG